MGKAETEKCGGSSCQTDRQERYGIIFFWIRTR
jgi:hypothetical protein